MQVEFHISESDYIAAAQLYHRTRNSAANILARLAVASRVARVGIVLGLLTFALAQGRSLVPVAAIAAVLLLPMLRMYFQRRKLAALYRGIPADQLQDKLELDGSGVVNHEAACRKVRPWSDFSRMEESRSTIILCMSRSTGYLILPKKKMTGEQIEELRQTVQLYLRSGNVGASALSRPQIGLSGQ